MKQFKYFQTYISGIMVNDKIIQRYVICKAKTLTEANRMLEALNIGKNIFKKDYTSEIEADTETHINSIKIADKDGIAFCVNGILGKEFISINDLQLQSIEVE